MPILPTPNLLGVGTSSDKAGIDRIECIALGVPGVRLAGRHIAQVYTPTDLSTGRVVPRGVERAVVEEYDISDLHRFEPRLTVSCDRLDGLSLAGVGIAVGNRPVAVAAGNERQAAVLFIGINQRQPDRKHAQFGPDRAAVVKTVLMVREGR